jgi:succinate dehydrogenase / fumarate reductase cytochrome b subunit
MAVTGLLMVLFAIFHMLGHLQMFGGPRMYNSYADFLQNLWEVKWPTRVILLGLLLLHTVLALSLSAKNRAARPVGYAVYRARISTPIGRTMAISGLIVLAFLIFHIYHFTLAPTHPGDAYHGFVFAFSHPLLYVTYLVGILLLSFHLGHGASSWLQSLGWRHPKYPVDSLGAWVSILLFVGYMLPPTAVLVGMIK